MNEKRASKSGDEDLNKLVRLLEEIVLTPVGQALQRNANYEVRQKKFREIMGLPPEPPLTEPLTDFEEASEYLEVFGHLHGHCESVVMEKLDRTGRLVVGLTWEEVERVVNDTHRCYLEGVEPGQEFAKANPHIVRKLMTLEHILIGIDFAKALGVAREFERKGVDGIAWLDGFWSGAQRAVSTTND